MYSNIVKDYEGHNLNFVSLERLRILLKLIWFFYFSVLDIIQYGFWEIMASYEWSLHLQKHSFFIIKLALDDKAIIFTNL